jgi:hypothetical protein
MRRATSAALLTMACVAGCTHTTGEVTRGPSTATRRPISSPVAATAIRLVPQQPIAQWQLSGSPFGFTSGHWVTGSGGVIVGKDVNDDLSVMRQAALVFPVPREASRCIQHVDLTLMAGRIRGVGAEIAVYPSDEGNYLASVRVPASNLDLSRLLDNRPRGDLAYLQTGRLKIDITALYRMWARGGPFPSQGRRLPPGTPFAVLLRPPAADDGQWSIELSTARAASELTVYRREGCRV